MTMVISIPKPECDYFFLNDDKKAK